MAKSNDEHNVANVESINTSAAEIISPLSTDSTVTDRLNIRQSDRGHSSAVYIYKSLYPETYMFSYRSFNQYFWPRGYSLKKSKNPRKLPEKIQKIPQISKNHKKIQQFLEEYIEQFSV